ncbi:hypothetical protein BDV41DRAFT_566419 [Aspergillus transmontanensis]|uniref:Uncharacterized protein n=1 Tax=Aspergillus transmontanensis TaxID=1034304 RepID=A0A5N6VQ11_9EURO|nr:hypothetical protein BDV41DRAFT_566419 [Aspergillus transmontanensis]
MDKYSSLYKEIHSLTALTSLIFQRPPDGIDYGDLSKEPEPGPDEELDKLPDETDFEDEVTTGDSTTALILLKQRSLDRLAEVLARFKTRKTGRHGRRKKKDANLDAKHVTSVAMVEDSTLQRVTFLCAKNEGLVGEDEVFLGGLCELLTSILKMASQRQTDQSKVFDLIFEHNTPQVEYYSVEIRDAFTHASSVKVPDTLTEDMIKDMGFIINIDGRQREASQQLPDCLSDSEIDKVVVETCDGIQSLFKISNSHTTRNDELRDFLERFYAIIRNPRQRPALKNLLKQALHGSEKLFRKVWDALLFLARTFHAAVTLVELASKLKLKLFNSFRFVPVSACMFKTKTYAPLGKELPLKVLQAVQCQPEGNGWVKLLQDQRTINEYTNILRLPKSIHAEVQLMSYLETSYSENNDQVFLYIGCSKKCCFFCEIFRALHGKFSARGTHETVFPRWGLPQGIAVTSKLEWLVLLMAKLAVFLRAMLQRVLSDPYPLPHRELCKQSSAALSTAQAEQQGESIYSERPSIFRFKDGCRLNTAQAEVFKLFVTIWGSIYQIPDNNSSVWINFGFCYCTSFQQRQELSLKYQLLAASNATFDDIVSAYETSSMAELMIKHEIDMSDLFQNGVRLQRPSGMVYSVFRLMIGVSHALSGRFCNFFRMQSCHGDFETHFDSECDLSYGFHLTNSWERWQLLNFYRHLFNLPEFDPRAMAAAKESPDYGALERYIDTLVPDMRRRIFDIDRAESFLFPNLDARISETIRGAEESSDIPCHCRVHDVLGPPGLCYRKGLV